MFTRDDARWLADTVGALYSAQSTAQLSALGIAAVYRRFHLVASCFEEISFDHSRYSLHGARGESALPSDHAAFIHDHPALHLIGPGTVLPTFQVRKLVSLRTWQRTDNFNGIARRMGFNDQLSILAYGPSEFLAFVVFRDTPFSDAEHEILALLQPHLRVAWFRVRSTPDLPRAPRSSRLMIDDRLHPVQMEPEQHRLLRRYFPRWQDRDNLPAELRVWVESSLRGLRQAMPPRPLHALITESVHGRLLVRCFPAPAGGTATLYLVETPHQPSFLQLRAHGLTARECEVLHWIALGKRDAEIASIIACSPATVGKHVEHLLAKLGAENRGAAVCTAQTRLEDENAILPRGAGGPHTGGLVAGS